MIRKILKNHKSIWAKKLISGWLIFLLLTPIQNIFSQTKPKIRGNSLQETTLKIELEELKKIILKKIDSDVDKTAVAFATSENIFRSLRVAYSFKAVLDSIDNAFTIIALPQEVIEINSLQSKTLQAVNGTLAVGSTLLVIENIQENAGKLATVFNSKSYLENVRKMLKAASSSQPVLGFDQARYSEGIKFQLGTSAGQEIITVNHRNQGFCNDSDLRGNLSNQPKKFRGTIETKHYIIEVFQKLSDEIDKQSFSDEQISKLLNLVSQAKSKVLESNLRNTDLTFPNLQNTRYCKSPIKLGRIASQQEILTNSYEALDKNLQIEQIQTVKTAFGAMTGTLQFYFNHGKGQKPGKDLQKLVEATSKVDLSIDLGNWLTEKKQIVSADELIGRIPQEMLLSLPLEFTETVRLVDSLAFIIKNSSNSVTVPPISPPPTVPVIIPEIPTLFLLDVSGSMQENNKIEQARASALNALDTLKDNQNKGLGNTAVSVWVFSGDACSPQMARQILPFTPNLNSAENSLRSQIPSPNGGTPLPQAVDRTTAQMISYLQSRPSLDEGRIILLSDGQSTCNQLRPADVYSQARSISIKKTVFYTIGFDVPVGSPAERDLQYLASASGGQYFPAKNQQQLARAFQKTIRVYLPKAIAKSSPTFDNGVQQIVKRNYAEAFKIWTIYVRSYPNEALGFYNLAVVCEALGRFKLAIDNYRQYLQLVGNAPDKAEIEAKVLTLEQEQRDQFYYYLELLRSDLDYLKAYYQRLFSGKNNELAQEFRGFVNEKQFFYANILETMEIKSNFIRRDTEDLTASMSLLNNRVGLESFNRDAVSLLTIPIGQLEDLIERLEKFGSQNFK